MSDKIIKERLHILPDAVWEIVASYGWLVGSGAKYLIDEDVNLNDVGDWDIIIPLDYWRDFQFQLRQDKIEAFELSHDNILEINNYGGYRFIWSLDEYGRIADTIDIWPHNLNDYLKSVPEDKPTLTININPPIICNKSKIN